MKHLLWLIAIVAIFAPAACLAIEPETKPALPTIRLYSEYGPGDSGLKNAAKMLKSTELSRVNGPYYLYMAYGAKDKIHVIVVTDKTDKSLRLQMTGPEKLICTMELPRMDVDIPKIGQYHFQLTRDGKPVGEDVRLDVIDLQQKPPIEVYVQTLRHYKTAGGNGTMVTATIKNTAAKDIDLGIIIKKMTDARVDVQVASRAWTFDGNQGALDEGQTYWPKHSSIYRSTTGFADPLSDDINTDQYFVTIKAGETLKIGTWFVQHPNKKT